MYAFERPRAFMSFFFVSYFAENEFWNLGEKTIPKTAICPIFLKPEQVLHLSYKTIDRAHFALFGLFDHF